MKLRNNYTWIKHYDFILIDLVTLMLSFVLSYYLKFNSLNLFQQSDWKSLFIIVCFINLLISFYLNIYSGTLRRRYYEQIIREIPLLFYQVIAVCILFYVLKIGTLFSREMMITTYVFYFCTSHIFKYIRKRIIISSNYSFEKTNILIVGDSQTIESTINNILVGDVIDRKIKYIYLTDYDETTKKLHNIPIVKSFKHKNVDEVFISTNVNDIPKELFKYFLDNGICVTYNIEKLFGLEAENTFVQNVGNYKGISVDQFSYDANKVGYFVLKRIFDIIFGILGLLILLPCALIIKICYMLNGDFKPIFYTQKRVGKDGKIIHLYKFRSMVYNADEVLKELLKDEKYRKEWEENQKFEDDPRITKIGKIIRKLSIDEIPQFINVLKNDMSLIRA